MSIHPHVWNFTELLSGVGWLSCAVVGAIPPGTATPRVARGSHLTMLLAMNAALVAESGAIVHDSLIAAGALPAAGPIQWDILVAGFLFVSSFVAV